MKSRSSAVFSSQSSDRFRFGSYRNRPSSTPRVVFPGTFMTMLSQLVLKQI
jgi:hypothetical protein